MVKLLGKNQLEVKDQNNCIRQVHVTDVKEDQLSLRCVKNIPTSNFGRAAKIEAKSQQY